MMIVMKENKDKVEKYLEKDIKRESDDDKALLLRDLAWLRSFEPKDIR